MGTQTIGLVSYIIIPAYIRYRASQRLHVFDLHSYRRNPTELGIVFVERSITLENSRFNRIANKERVPLNGPQHFPNTPYKVFLGRLCRICVLIMK